MKDFKEMQSDSDQVVEIKLQQDQCPHRIAELYSHPNCEKLAQICEKRCKNNLVHDMAKMLHDRKPVDQFKAKFNKLQAMFTELADNYMKQLDKIEKIAFDNIAKKKVDCLNEIVEYKKELMKQTYSDLSNKFPHLYEKFKSNRLDTLNCNQVSWVMKTDVRNYNQKHSAIGTQFVKIIKKFQDFKDVSKNLPQKLFTKKQNAKDIKIISKSPQQQHVVRLKPNISIEKPNYYQDKTKQELQYLQKKKRQLESSIKNLTSMNSKLSDQISKRIFQKREKQIRVKITGKVIDWHFENINKLTKPLNSKVLDDQSDSESHSSSLSPQIYQKLALFNAYPTILQIINKERLSQNKEKPTKDTLILQKGTQENRMINEAAQNIQKASDKVVIPQKPVAIHQENKDKIDEQMPQNQENTLNHPIMSQVPAKPQPNQQNVVNMQVQKQATNKVDSKDKKPSAQVKKQYTEDNGFQEWNNQQLVADIKRYGKNEQQGLKVENIEGLRSFTHVRLPSAKLKINPFLKKINKADTTPSKPLQYQDLAKVLMEQYMKGKQKQKDDKDRRL